jgi:sugar-specific transcriptional regulator TrmB
MPSQDFIHTLQKFGMTEREAKLYMAMLEKQETTAAELHRISGVMRSRTYETLEQMVSKGYCHERVENKRRFFRATRPSELMDLFQRGWLVEQEWRKEASGDFVGTLESKFENLADSDQLIDFIEVIRSRDQIHQRYVAQIKAVTSEVLAFNRSPYACLDPAVLKEQEEAVLASLAKGVKTRTLYMKEAEHWAMLERHLSEIDGAGEDFKIIAYLPMKMYIFDRKRVMLALPAIPGQSEADFTMLIVEEPGFTESCVVLFDVYWEKARTLEEVKNGSLSV